MQQILDTQREPPPLAPIERAVAEVDAESRMEVELEGAPAGEHVIPGDRNRLRRRSFRVVPITHHRVRIERGKLRIVGTATGIVRPERTWARIEQAVAALD